MGSPEEEPSMRCTQCGRPATISIVDTDTGKGMPLCLDCNLKFEHARTLEFERLVIVGNLAASELESASGIPVPRYQMPQNRVLQVNGMTTNNIKIDRSTIGAINTGTIGTLDSSITVLRGSGQPGVAEAVKSLTEAIAANAAVADEVRRELLELLSFVASEATAPEESRRSGAARRVLQDIANAITSVAGLASLWKQFEPVLRSAFL
jgi:hypothetical protein